MVSVPSPTYLTRFQIFTGIPICVPTVQASTYNSWPSDGAGRDGLV